MMVEIIVQYTLYIISITISINFLLLSPIEINFSYRIIGYEAQ